MKITSLVNLRKGVLKSKLQPLKDQLKRTIKTPFTDRTSRRLILHCCHHKVGTTWFRNILSQIAREYGLAFQSCNQNELRQNTDIFLQNHSLVDLSLLPYYWGSHMIRDPRDVIISGYFYHLWTKEQWSHIPKAKYGNMSYQQYLNSLDREEGILAEMERFASYDLKHMIEWDYNNPNFLEFKYEDIINNEKQIFYEIFKHYGFSESAINVSLRIAKNFSFKNVTKRNLGETKDKSHLRSGCPGEWRELFSEQHKAHCKCLLGDALIKLGYEFDYSW